MNLITEAANAVLRNLGFTPADIAAMLAAPNDNWAKLVHHMQALDPRHRSFIADGIQDDGFPEEARTTHGPHFRAVEKANYDECAAAWVLLYRMRDLYSGKVAGLDPKLCADGSHARTPQRQLIRQALLVLNADTRDEAALNQALSDLREAIGGLYSDSSFTALVAEVVAELEQSLTGDHQS